MNTPIFVFAILHFKPNFPNNISLVLNFPILTHRSQISVTAPMLKNIDSNILPPQEYSSSNINPSYEPRGQLKGSSLSICSLVSRGPPILGLLSPKHA